VSCVPTVLNRRYSLPTSFRISNLRHLSCCERQTDSKYHNAPVCFLKKISNYHYDYSPVNVWISSVVRIGVASLMVTELETHCLLRMQYCWKREGTKVLPTFHLFKTADSAFQSRAD
jgi:hypothetical protein